MGRTTTLALVGAALLATLGAAPRASAAAQQRPRHVVVFGLPGITWTDVESARTPALDRIAERGAMAATVVRSAIWRTTTPRGYLTIGAGQRAYAHPTDPVVHLALPAEAGWENGTAAQAVTRRFPDARRGDIVQPEFAYIAQRTAGPDFGTQPGALGEALAAAGLRRAVVVAGDLGIDPDTQTMRRSAVLGLADTAGVVDAGTVDGLLRPAPDAPYGVETDPERFADAVQRAMAQAQVVLVDPGETSRADELALRASPEQADVLRRRGLEAADRLLATVAGMLGPQDVLIVVAPAGPAAFERDVLTPLVVSGPGFEPGLLTSSTTRRAGLAALVDVSPTVLGALGIEAPTSFGGAPLRSVHAGGERLRHLIRLDEETVLHARFSPLVGILWAALVTLAAALGVRALVVRRAGAANVAAAAAAAVLAVPPAALAVRALRPTDLLGAALVLCGMVVAAALAARLVRGPRLAGVVAVLLASAAVATADLVAGSPLQPNSAFGASPVVGGRYYGIGNYGGAILVSAAMAAVGGLALLWKRDRLGYWTAGVLTGLVFLIGFPAFGANFGGFVSGLPAVAVLFLVGRYGAVRWRALAGLGMVAVLLGSGLLALDATRPFAERTHFGRFAAEVASGNGAFLVTILRKLQSSVATLAGTRWLYVVVVSGLLLVYLALPSGVGLWAAWRGNRVLRAVGFGALVAAVVGFAVNDSGLAISALVAVQTVLFFLVWGLDERVPVPEVPAPARTGPLDEPVPVAGVEPGS